MKASFATSLRPTRLAASVRVADVAKDDPLKRKMAHWYSDYAKTYDQDGFHTRIATRLIEGLEIRRGDRILDVATGTCLAGFSALAKAGESGSLVGVDISEAMLEKALSAATAMGVKNVEFVLADAQKMDLPKESFDVVICSSALVLFPDEESTLRYWHTFLVPGGRLAVHCFSEKSYVRGKLIQKAAAEFGIELVFSEPTGTPQKCRQLLQKSGYTSIVIDEVIGGSYESLESILGAWDKMILHPMIQLPSLVPDAGKMEAIKDRFVQLAKEMETEKGLWDDNTIMYVYGRKA